MNRRYRKTIIAGNWKMNKTSTEAKKFADDFKALLPKTKWCDVVVCVPSVDISAAVRAFKDSRVAVGAQNLFYEDHGAYTGEVSAAMLCDLGVKYVIVGHSERRAMFGEYIVSLNGKNVVSVCDNCVFVKEMPALAEAFRGAERGFPYDGAKEHYILDMEDRALLDEVVPLLDEHMPLPKPRKKKA